MFLEPKKEEKKRKEKEKEKEQKTLYKLLLLSKYY